MATKQEKIKKQINKGRQSYLRWTVLREKDLLSIYQDSAARVVDFINQHAKGGTVAASQKAVLLDRINKEIVALRGTTVSNITKNMRKSIEMGGKDAVASLSDIVPDKFKAALATNFGSFSKQALKAMVSEGMADGIPLSTRIWKITSVDAKIGVQRQLGLAITQGTSADELSRKVRNLLVQPSTIRGRKILANIHPGQGVYKSAYKNALRVARTELNRAYIRGQSEYAKSKPWITGFIRREPGPAEDDECGQAKDKFFVKGTEPELFHPNCMGYNEPVLDEDKLFGEGA